MKKTAILIILAAAAMACCASAKIASSATADPDEISWNAFCDARGYNRDSGSSLIVNEFLDAWRGSAAEEDAFIAAGVEPY